ncbi:MAG: DUF3696 domain-containing protein [Desulfovibrio sp.]|jgi:predicted ATPase|nr:DUF3696 domain-containing protein [Desulfovibrio sp.]
MITGIHLRHFKSFVDETLVLRPLTVLAGLNSSGKSSILQAVRIAQTGRLPYGLGSPRDMCSVHSDGDFAISCSYTTAKGETVGKEVAYNHQTRKLTSRTTVSQTGKPAFPHCFFIVADRLGPKTTLPTRDDALLRPADAMYVGEDGSYVLDVLERYKNAAKTPVELRAPTCGHLAGFLHNIDGWLQEISPGFQVRPIALTEGDVGTLKFMVNKADRRSSNVGFGLSYVLPILVTVLLCAIHVGDKRHDNPVVIVENPEAHLHPRGQTMMGGFLAKAAAYGVQTIVETHSDHLFDGIRLAVKNGILAFDKVASYFSRYDIQEEKSAITPITIDKYGMCNAWPDGFFDENAKNLMALV